MAINGLEIDRLADRVSRHFDVWLQLLNDFFTCQGGFPLSSCSVLDKLVSSCQARNVWQTLAGSI